MNEYRQKELSKKQEVLKELNETGSNYKFELVPDKNNEGYDTIEMVGLIPVSVNFNEYEKKYRFFLDYHGLQFVTYDTYKQVAEKYETPNQIGKLHKNKVNAWVDYLIKIYEELVQLSQERTQKVDEYIKTMESEGAKIIKADYRNVYHGSITKGGIRLTFEVGETGHIYEKLEIPYETKASLTNFKRIADNKYIG